MAEFESFDWSGISYSQTYMKSLFDYVSVHPFVKGLELGFDQGASALAFLRACPEAKLTSVDISQCEGAQARVRANGFGERFTFIEGDSREVLKSIEGKFDLIYIDADHLYEPTYEDLVNSSKLLVEGGYMIADDADPTHQNFGSGRAIDRFCSEYGFIKQQLDGSPSAAVVLRKL